jgi:hypothetical protein
MASASLERVPFALAIASPKLLKPRFDTLSKPQQSALKIMYGLPLDEEGLVHWSIFQGGAEYDELGYVKNVTMIPYTPREYSRVVGVFGRRSGKTDQIFSTASAYEITLGGHKRFVREGQQFKMLFLAQTVGDAQQNMNFIRLALQESPELSKLLAEKDVASEIRLKNGLVVEPAPANKSIGRGHAIPVALLDENAFWYTDKDAANPDFEVLRAIRHAQSQFPDSKVFLPSTPWAEQGILWEAYQAGTLGRKLRCDACKAKSAFICEHYVEEREQFEDTLVMHASTAAMESLDAVLKSKELARRRLQKIRREDPEAFPRESLALFIKTIAGWLNTEKIAKAIDHGVHARTRQPRVNYIAAMDPAFRNDSFAFTIVHHDPKLGIVQDWVEYWEPEPGIPLKPGDVLDQIKQRLQMFGLEMVYSDQYQLESLQQLALDRGFSISGYDFTGKSKAVITGGFRMLLNQERVRLLDHEVQRDQLEKLQKRVMQSGTVQIAAPPGKHDDLAMVLMLATRIALWLLTEEPSADERPLDIETDHVKMFLQQIERQRREAERFSSDY